MKSVFDRLSYSAFLYISILAFPILFMSVPRTTTALSTVLAVLCIISLAKNKVSILSSSNQKLVTLAFCVYPITIILTQLALNKFTLSDYQQQGRILLLLPLFYYIFYKKINLANLAKFCIPFACIFGALSSIYLFPSPPEQWGIRHTVSHIDPLNFGYLMLFLAFSSLMLALRWKTNKWHQLLCAVAFVCGIYMSIKSGSRTGWLAIPFASLYILHTAGKVRTIPLLLATVTIVFLALILYKANNTFQSRTNDFLNGFIHYTWAGNPNLNYNSIGERISMLRMGFYAFTQAPWFGFGSENLYNILNIDPVKIYATEVTIKFASDGFMHNEFVTQLVKHGIFGGLAYLFILFTIVRIFIKANKLRIASPMIDVFMIYIIFAVIAGLSTEILIVKPMILFFGFMLACFAGEALWRIEGAEAKAQALPSVSPSGSNGVV